jgi:short-subunit dehydrogenase
VSARSHVSFRERYGPFALIAGASEGLGAAFASALAARGLSLVLVARRADVLATLAASLRAQFNVTVETAAIDLSRPDLVEALAPHTSPREIGLVVYNAAYSLVSTFLAQPLDEQMRMIDVNCRGPLALLRSYIPAMTERGRGGVILMSSLAGFQGAPGISVYGATKAFNRILAEGLWYELGPQGVDVLACCAGATRTPGYLRTAPSDAPGALDPEDVAAQTLDALSRTPIVIPGRVNRIANAVMSRALTRKAAVRLMGRATAGLQKKP